MTDVREQACCSQTLSSAMTVASEARNICLISRSVQADYCKARKGHSQPRGTLSRAPNANGAESKPNLRAQQPSISQALTVA